MPYDSLKNINPALKGIDPPITLGQANEIAKQADAIGADKNGQPFSVGREFVSPESISHSVRDNNAIANHIRDMVSKPLSSAELLELRTTGNGPNGSRLNSQLWE